MERSYLLLLGSLSGLVSVLTHAVIWSLIDLLRRSQVQTPSAARLDIPELFLHMLAGTGLGLLFWLSWGLAAVVDVPWWVRGLAFGAMTWLFLGLPALISLARMRSIAARPTAVVAAEWATTCLIVGLTCAWSWGRAV